MDTINKEKLILSLIKDDLINNCLIRKLERIGLYSECYYLHLSSTDLKTIKKQMSCMTNTLN